MIKMTEPLIIWQNNHDKEIVKAMATKFSENFAIDTHLTNGY